MKQLGSFIQKEIYHIVRDKLTLLIMFILPIILLLILGFAVSTEIRNASFVVLDQSKTSDSQELINKIDGNNYFSFVRNLNTNNEIEAAFQKGECKLAIIIPPHFAKDLYHTGMSNIQIMVDASDPNESSTLASYCQLILLQYQQEKDKSMAMKKITMEIKMLYNPQLKSAYNFVPGLIGMLMMIICAMMTSVSIVKEKELGTMEILLVSPLKPSTIILAKAVPYFFISILDVVLILVIAYFLLGVPIVGNIVLIMLLSIIFIFSTLALGLLISSVTETQQAAMIMSTVGLMLPSMLLSGLIFPISSMPTILQVISNIIPAQWFIDALRSVMIKGLGFTDIWVQLLILTSMTVLLLLLSIKNFKNRL